MNINVNLVPRKKGLLKKLIILILFAFCCFFIKENVFAADLDGSNTTSSMPPFLKDYYTINTSSATCDDETQSYCNMYNYLEQHFAEYHTLYKNVVVLTQYNYYAYPYNTYTYIYFFLDKPYISENNSSKFADAENITFLDSDGKPLKYYRIGFKHTGYNIEIEYFYGSENNSTLVPTLFDERNEFTSILTNFDLYSQDGTFYHESDVQNWTYVNLKSSTGLMLIPKSNKSFSSYFSYDKENIYISWYDINSKTNLDYLEVDKPVSDTLSYYINFTTDRINKYYFIIANKGVNTAEIGYISDDFNIVIFEDLYSSSVGSDGNSYDNPLSDLFDDINNDIVFDTELSILDNIVKFFSNFGNYLLTLGNNIIKGISNALDDFSNFIVNGIKDLFIPGDELEGFFEDEYYYIKQQLGFLTYPIEVVVDFANRFYKLDNSTSAVFKIPKLEIFNHTLYEGTSFNLMSLVNENDNFKNIYNIYRIAVSGFIVLWLVNLAVKKEHEIFGGGN